MSAFSSFQVQKRVHFTDVVAAPFVRKLFLGGKLAKNSLLSVSILF